MDGFDPDLTDKWIADGSLPNLATISSAGVFSKLQSTIPPFTYPAWSSLLTGVNPGRHGITDFAVRQPGSYSVSYINSTYRLEPTFFNRLSQIGKRVVAIGFPTTYPPEPVNGIMISGFDSPLAYTADKSFCYPRSLWDELKSNVSAYTLAGIQELDTSADWRERAQETIRHTIASRTAIAEYLYQKEKWDCFGIVFSESDTAAHHFWAAHDSNSPRHRPEDAEYSQFLREVYQSLDASVGRLVGLADSETLVLVVSDHGSGGAGNRMLSLNRALAEHGFFTYRHQQASNREITFDHNHSEFKADSPKQSWLRKLAFMLPAQIGEWFFRYAPRNMLDYLESKHRLAYADLKNSIAFSDELNYFPSVWLNDERFPFGKSYNIDQRDQILKEIKTALLSIKKPVTGNPLISRIYFKHDLYYGAALEWIPDLIIVPAMDGDYTVTLWNAPSPGPILSELPEQEIRGRKGGSMNGSHRPFGVLFSNAPICLDDQRVPCLEDIGATVLSLFGVETKDLDGIPLFETLTENTFTDSNKGDDLTEGGDRPIPYTKSESREIQERLKRLGYL